MAAITIVIEAEGRKNRYKLETTAEVLDLFLEIRKKEKPKTICWDSDCIEVTFNERKESGLCVKRLRADPRTKSLKVAG